MSDHSQLLDRYRRAREVMLRLNNLLVTTIPKDTLEDCVPQAGVPPQGNDGLRNRG